MLSWLIALSICSGWQDIDLSARANLKAGRLVEAEVLWKEAVARAEADKELDPGVVDCLIGLSSVYDKKGDVAESERLYELAMRTVEGIKGGDSALYADRLPDLAWMYRRHGKSQMAEVLMLRLVKIREKTAGKDSQEVATALETYGKFLSDEGRSAESGKLNERAQAIRYALSDGGSHR